MNQCHETGEMTHCRQQAMDPLSGLPVAMGYVPWQNLGTIYEPDKALREGTMFPELNKPFGGRRIK